MPASVFAEQGEQPQLRMADRYDDLERSTLVLPFFQPALLDQPFQERPGDNTPFIAVEIINILHAGTVGSVTPEA